MAEVTVGIQEADFLVDEGDFCTPANSK